MMCLRQIEGRTPIEGSKPSQCADCGVPLWVYPKADNGSVGVNRDGNVRPDEEPDRDLSKLQHVCGRCAITRAEAAGEHRAAMRLLEVVTQVEGVEYALGLEEG